MGHQQQHVQGVVVVEHGAVHLEHADIQYNIQSQGIFTLVRIVRYIVVVTNLLNVSHLLDKPVQTLGHAAHLHHAVVPV